MEKIEEEEQNYLNQTIYYIQQIIKIFTIKLDSLSNQIIKEENGNDK